MKLPQLSLRDLFWLVALVAMGCGWWMDHRQQFAERIAMAQKATMWRQRAHWLAFVTRKSLEIWWTESETITRPKGIPAYSGMLNRRYQPGLDIDDQPLGIAVKDGESLSTWDGEPASVLPDDYR